MTHDVVCIDGQFPEAAKKFWTQWGVVWPEQEKMYTIREVVKTTTGKVGLLLEELVNPKVPIKHPILGEVMYEPNWRITRFATLAGDEIEVNTIKELLKQ